MKKSISAGLGMMMIIQIGCARLNTKNVQGISSNPTHEDLAPPDGQIIFVRRNKLQLSSDLLSFDLRAGVISTLKQVNSFVPSFCISQDGQRIAYASRSKNKSKLMILDGLGKNTLVREAKSERYMNCSFLPDGNGIVFSKTINRGTEIFVTFPPYSQERQLTFSAEGTLNIDPAVSPDGKSIAFTSDRSGRPTIYRMNVDGSAPKRIVFAGSYNSEPVWSPDSSSIVFSGYDPSKKNYDLFKIDHDGKNMARLTSSKIGPDKWSNNEKPAFSPNGKFIAYVSDRTGQKQIFTVDLAGRERRLTSDSLDFARPLVWVR
jgi:TolB protein